MKNFNNKKRALLFTLIILAIGLYFYKLGDIPHGINIDEVGTIYDSISLSRYGYDRYLINNPLYFWNYGDGASAMMFYLLALWIKILPFNPLDLNSLEYTLFAFRIVVVLFNLIGYFFFYKLLRKEFTINQSLFGILMVLILPISIMHSRWILDCYLIIPMVIIAFYSLILAIEKRKKISWFLSGILWGLVLYTYVLSYVVIVLFLLITAIYLFKKKKVTIEEVIWFIIPIFILGFPLFIQLLINLGILNVNHLDWFGFSINKLPIVRESEIGFMNVLSNLFNPDWWLSPFIDYEKHNAYLSFSTIYWVNLPVLLLGLIRFKENIKESQISLLMYFLFSSGFAFNLFIKLANVNKVSIIFIPFCYFLVKGYMYIFKNYKALFKGIVMACAISLVFFTNTYFNDYKERIFFEYDLVNLFKGVNLDDQKVYVNDERLQVYPYIYYLFINDVKPNENLLDFAVMIKECDEDLIENDVAYVVNRNSMMFNRLMEDERKIIKCENDLCLVDRKS